MVAIIAGRLNRGTVVQVLILKKFIFKSISYVNFELEWFTEPHALGIKSHRVRRGGGDVSINQKAY